MEIIITLLIGAVAGWLGSLIYKGSGLGLLGNVIVGILGGVVGYWLMGKLNISLGNSWLSVILTSTIGAIIILFLFNLVFRKK